MSPSARRRPRLHRLLIVAEALLVLGLARDFGWKFVRASAVPDWGKVLLAMALTLGAFGGIFVLARSLFVDGVARTHQVARGAFGATVLLHAALLLVLFELYARMLGFHMLERLL